MRLDNNIKKEFVNYFVQILNNLKREHDKLEIIGNEKSYLYELANIAMNMTLSEVNPNYLACMDYMPSNYNKLLFDNPNGNGYDAPFWKINDEQRNNLYKKAYSIFINQKDSSY